jgi:hypothetical protein
VIFMTMYGVSTLKSISRDHIPQTRSKRAQEQKGEIYRLLSPIGSLTSIDSTFVEFAGFE